MGTARKGPDHVAHRRQELLDAALTAIRRLGPSTSMDDIAREAGITRPILYRYFGDRGGLTNAVAGNFAARLAGVVGSPPDSEIPVDTVRLAKSMVARFFEIVEEDPMVYRFVVHRALFEDIEARGSLHGLLEVIGRQLAMVIGELLREDGRDSGPAELWAIAALGMVSFSADWWLERRTLSRDAVVSYLTSLVTHGLTGPDGGGVTSPSNPLLKVAQAAAADVVGAAAGAVSSTIRRVPKGSDT